MNEIQRLRSLSQVNRTNYQNRQLQERKNSDRSQENSVKILNYDASTGRYRAINTAGQIFAATTISNGVVKQGETVSLLQPTGGIPIIDAMPR